MFLVLRCEGILRAAGNPQHTTENYSFRKLSTGVAVAAFMVWKLIVINAMNKAIKPAIANTHQLIEIL